MDNKILIGLAVLVVLGVVGITQLGNADLVTGMVGAKMAGGGYGGGFMLCWVVVKLVSLAVVTFMVSAIFWWTKKLVLGNKK
jgi:uncharacterized membrane protein|tara:strand:- start:940 stop:1185 length:246 start_codon:yes stop_codon:yes gene_type:complete